MKDENRNIIATTESEYSIEMRKESRTLPGTAPGPYIAIMDTIVATK